jgi:hypothetical protein
MPSPPKLRRAPLYSEQHLEHLHPEDEAILQRVSKQMWGRRKRRQVTRWKVAAVMLIVVGYVCAVLIATAVALSRWLGI